MRCHHQTRSDIADSVRGWYRQVVIRTVGLCTPVDPGDWPAGFVSSRSELHPCTVSAGQIPSCQGAGSVANHHTDARKMEEVPLL